MLRFGLIGRQRLLLVLLIVALVGVWVCEPWLLSPWMQMLQLKQRTLARFSLFRVYMCIFSLVRVVVVTWSKSLVVPQHDIACADGVLIGFVLKLTLY